MIEFKKNKKNIKINFEKMLAEQSALKRSRESPVNTGLKQEATTAALTN